MYLCRNAVVSPISSGKLHFQSASQVPSCRNTELKQRATSWGIKSFVTLTQIPTDNTFKVLFLGKPTRFFINYILQEIWGFFGWWKLESLRVIDGKLIYFLCCSGSISDSLLWAPLLLLGSNYSSPKIHINVAMGLNKGRIAEKLLIWNLKHHVSLVARHFSSKLKSKQEVIQPLVLMAMVPLAQVVTSSPFTSDLNALSPIGGFQGMKFFLEFCQTQNEAHINKQTRAFCCLSTLLSWQIKGFNLIVGKKKKCRETPNKSGSSNPTTK